MIEVGDLVGRNYSWPIEDIDSPIENPKNLQFDNGQISTILITKMPKYSILQRIRGFLGLNIKAYAHVLVTFNNGNVMEGRVRLWEVV